MMTDTMRTIGIRHDRTGIQTTDIRPGRILTRIDIRATATGIQATDIRKIDIRMTDIHLVLDPTDSLNDIHHLWIGIHQEWIDILVDSQ